MTKGLLTAAALMVATAVFGQGTVIFNNRNLAAGIDARVVGPDGLGISGSELKADLIAGPAGTAVSALVPVPNSVTTFRTGSAAGYVNPITVTIPNIAPGAQATVAMRAYNGSSYETSSRFCTSRPITIPTGNPLSNPPELPTELVGLNSACIPEPSKHALAVLGAAALFFCRKRKWR